MSLCSWPSTTHVLCVVLAMTLAACASNQTGASKTPATITLTAKDSGATVTATAGASIVVRLGAVTNFKWSMPDSSDGGVVGRTGGAVGSDGSAEATFAVIGPGQAMLSAVDNPRCFPICALPPAGGWNVTIIVK